MFPLLFDSAFTRKEAGMCPHSYAALNSEGWVSVSPALTNEGESAGFYCPAGLQPGNRKLVSPLGRHSAFPVFSEGLSEAQSFDLRQAPSHGEERGGRSQHSTQVSIPISSKSLC